MTRLRRTLVLTLAALAVLLGLTPPAGAAYSDKAMLSSAVTAVFADGTRYPVAQVAAPATSVTGDYDAYYAAQNIRVAATTTTSYGWTATSPMSGVITC